MRARDTGATRSLPRRGAPAWTSRRRPGVQDLRARAPARFDPGGPGGADAVRGMRTFQSRVLCLSQLTAGGAVGCQLSLVGSMSRRQCRRLHKVPMTSEVWRAPVTSQQTHTGARAHVAGARRRQAHCHHICQGDLSGATRWGAAQNRRRTPGFIDRTRAHASACIP